MNKMLLMISDFVFKMVLRTGKIASLYGMHQPKEPKGLKRISEHLIRFDKDE